MVQVREWMLAGAEFVCSDLWPETIRALLYRQEGPASLPAIAGDIKIQMGGDQPLRFARPIRLFLSYAPEDERFCHQMERHLGVLRHQGVIQSWNVGMVQAGQMKDAVAQKALDSADVVVVLISADLVGADTPFAELQRALTRHAAGEARVIPVRVRPVDLANTPLGLLQALPEGGKPVTTWPNADEAWTDVAKEIRRVVMSMAEVQ